jgi:DNA-binding XRE family transcriptional regulator
MRNSIFEKYDFKAIGQAIKDARENKGITREELAEKLDLAARYIMSVENQGREVFHGSGIEGGGGAGLPAPGNHPSKLLQSPIPCLDHAVHFHYLLQSKFIK